MINKALSAYTPSNMDADTLEAMFVQRHQLLAQSVGWVEESLLTDKKNHLLFIGPRGCGKTHLITMIINRLKVSERLDDLIVIWLGEDDVVMNLTGLALAIINKMALAYPQRFNNDCLAQAKGKSADEVADIILDDIKKQAGDTTLLLVKENMNDAFSGLKDLGQKRLRAYLQENRHLSILGTSQKLFNGVSSRDAAFWGFFDVQHLATLGVDDALLLISNIAKINQDDELVDFLHTTQGNYRIRALHYLAGGNHRLYVELTRFLTKASLDDFVDAIMQLADHLTPYFQERIRSLSPQQATIIQKLCELNGAIQVKVIAESLFIDERAVASQLKDLKDMGYVIAHKRGRAAYYEIAEPLLRLSLEIKNNHGKPLKIVASLFRAWFSDTELQTSMSKGNALLRAYCKTALENNEILGNLEQSIVKDLSEQIDKNNYKKVIDYTSELLCLADIDPQNNTTKRAATLFKRSVAYAHQGKVEKELSDLNQVIAMADAASEIIAWALFSRSITYTLQNDFNACIADLQQLNSLKEVSSPLKNMGLFFLPLMYYRLSDMDSAQRYLKLAFEQGDRQAENYPYDTDFMLFTIVELGVSRWQSEIEFLLSLYAEYDELSHLATGLIQVIQHFIDDEMLSLSFGQWANLWQIASDAYPPMQPAIAAVNASAEALAVGNDKPLFALPKEIRALIVPMFEGIG